MVFNVSYSNRILNNSLHLNYFIINLLQILLMIIVQLLLIIFFIYVSVKNESTKNAGKFFIHSMKKSIHSDLKKFGLKPLADPGPAFECPKCGRKYHWKQTLSRHLRLECGKEPTFQCPYCPHRSKVKSNLVQHVRSIHCSPLVYYK